MTSFEAGFITAAVESGMSSNEASRLYKSAMEYPGSQEMFKQLPDQQQLPQHEAMGMKDMAMLLKQHLIDEHFNGQRQQIEL